MSYKPDAPGTYQGKQVIINSDRLLFNAKNDSILLFSDKAIGFSTKGSFHFDTSQSDESKFVVNAPNIYLGLSDEGNLPLEPAVLGDKLEIVIEGILVMVENVIGSISTKLMFGANNAKNASTIFKTNKKEIELIRKTLKSMKSQTTKLI